MNARATIQARYETMSKTNRKIADCILEDVEAFLKMTALEAAECYATSSASVIRFAKYLGYKGLDELKIALAMELPNQEVLYDFDTIITHEDDIDTMCQKVQLLAETTVRDLFASLNHSDVQEAIELLSQSDNIVLFGIGASMLSAYDMYHKLKRIHLKAHYEFDPHMGIEFLNYVNEHDTVMAFSYSGLSKEILYPCQVAKSKGATVIAVTRKGSSPLSEMADLVLNVPDNEHLTRVGAISSKLSSMLVVDLLYLGIMQKDDQMYEDKLIETSLLTRKMKEEK